MTCHGQRSAVKEKDNIITYMDTTKNHHFHSLICWCYGCRNALYTINIVVITRVMPDHPKFHYRSVPTSLAFPLMRLHSSSLSSFLFSTGNFILHKIVQDTSGRLVSNSARKILSQLLYLQTDFVSDFRR